MSGKKSNPTLLLLFAAGFLIFIIAAVMLLGTTITPKSNSITAQSEYYGFGDFHNWGDTSYPGGWDVLFPQMQAKGANAFRLAFLFEDCAQFGMTSANGTFWNDAEVEALIAKAYSYELQTVLDLHLIWCPGYLESQNWIDNWEDVASRYKDDPRIAAFEIYNEPYSAKQSYTQYQLHERFAQCARAIHEIDPDRKIIWFPACITWNGGVKDSETKPYYDHPSEFLEPYIILNNHLWNIGIDSAQETEEAALYGIQYMAKLKEQYNREVIIGETGGAIGEAGTVPDNYNAYEAQQAYVRTFAIEAPKYGVGVLFWEANWNWDSIYTEGLRDVTFP
jgi:aryl-phospho-beta-D-glucosidase BglC (GH1 family)